MTAPELPRPYAWYLHPEEAARYAAGGLHCETRRCHELAVVITTYFFARNGRPIPSEHLACLRHGTEFARRHHIEIWPAPEEPPPVPERRPGGPRAYLGCLTDEAIAAQTAHGWRCGGRRCVEVARFLSVFRWYTKAGKVRLAARFVCDRHAALFAARHGIDLAAAPVTEGWLP